MDLQRPLEDHQQGQSDKQEQEPGKAVTFRACFTAWKIDVAHLAFYPTVPAPEVNLRNAPTLRIEVTPPAIIKPSAAPNGP